MKDAIIVEIKVPDFEDIQCRLNKATQEIQKCYQELAAINFIFRKEEEPTNE